MSMPVILAGCPGLTRDNLELGALSGCPSQTAAMLAENQSQPSALSDTPVLFCNLNVLRDSQDKSAGVSALGSRLCLYLAERETNPEKREKLAVEGVNFAEAALRQGGDSGVVHYYLALNLGLAVRDHIILAMANIGRLENEMKRALALSPEIDDGGPLRILGMLYLKAPAWPKGMGDRDKALELLERAVKQYPGHPLNHLFYAQALWDESDETVSPKVKDEIALGETLLAEGDWGYSKTPWKIEFEAFNQEIKEAGGN